METRIDEIAERIYRLSTFMPDIGPTGFTFNQFLIDADEPTIFHTGPRGLFSGISEAIASLMPLDRLRWVMFGHLEADECGAMNLFLEAAPNAQVAHTAIGCMVSIDDLADRPPVPFGPDASLDLGGRSIRSIDTPHVPHGWDAHVLYEETTGTLLCGDLLSQVGDGPALTEDDLVGRSRSDRGHVWRELHYTPVGVHHPPTLCARTDHTRDHARFLLQRRRKCRTQRPRRRLRTSDGPTHLTTAHIAMKDPLRRTRASSSRALYLRHGHRDRLRNALDHRAQRTGNSHRVAARAASPTPGGTTQRRLVNAVATTGWPPSSCRT